MAESFESMFEVKERIRLLIGCDEESLHKYESFLLRVSDYGKSAMPSTESLNYDVCRKLLEINALKETGVGFVELDDVGKEAMKYLSLEEDLGLEI